MRTKMPPLAVLADACILVKDIVSNVLYDLHVAGQIELYWTPEIEAEYIYHRARLRAHGDRRTLMDADLVWSSARIEVIKKYLVKQSTPSGWIEPDTLFALRSQKDFAPLNDLQDKGDIHVAMGAAYLAQNTGRAIILVTDNVRDFAPQTLQSFHVAVMHQGDLLQLLYDRDPHSISQSLLKTARDFQDPEISPEKMLKSIASRHQFWNLELARELARMWAIPSDQAK